MDGMGVGDIQRLLAHLRRVRVPLTVDVRTPSFFVRIVTTGGDPEFAGDTAIDAPASGTFRSLAQPGTVKMGDLVGVVQTRTGLRLPVRAPASGHLSSCLVAHGSQVGRATKLFTLAKSIDDA